ncbi:hypothetical protein ACE6JH_01270 [Streptomyces nigra]
MVVFAEAGGVNSLLAARILQGISTGAAVGALGAGMLDIDARRGGFLNSLTPTLGTAAAPWSPLCSCSTCRPRPVWST